MTQGPKNVSFIVQKCSTFERFCLKLDIKSLGITGHYWTLFALKSPKCHHMPILDKFGVS